MRGRSPVGYLTYCSLSQKAVHRDYSGIPEQRGHHRITIDSAAANYRIPASVIHADGPAELLTVPETAEPLFEYHRAIPDQPGCIFIHRHASGEHPLRPRGGDVPE